MSATSEYFEQLIVECGGLGRFQGLMLMIGLGSKLSVAWTMLMMIFAGAVPNWHCENETNQTTHEPVSHVNNECQPPGGINVTSCQLVRYDTSMNTVVNEWSLICDKKWIVSTTTTIQMSGILFSGFIVGHLADHFGRKPIFFLALFLLSVLNTIAGFSTSWQMFMAVRFLLGFAMGCYLIVYFNYMVEFFPRRHRTTIMAIPSWPIVASLFGVVCMWLHDWRYLHFAISICTLPFLFTWRFLPESFRWLLAHNKIEEAEEVIKNIAKWNNKPVPDLSKLSKHVEDLKVKSSKVYTIKDLFSNLPLIKTTILLAVIWFSTAYGFYAIAFGVESLSGNLYINMVLISVVDIPSGITASLLCRCIGRKKTMFLFYFLGAVSGITVAIIQRSDIGMKATLINGLALTAKLGVGAGWASLMIITTETYPTVIRNIGYGMMNTFARTGSMIAPQIVFLNAKNPGLLYFLCGGLMSLSCLCTVFLQETRGKAMGDAITKDIEQKCQKSNEKDNTTNNNEIIVTKF